MGATLTEGFEYYFRPTVQRVDSAFRDGLLVIDTNILLNVMRYSPPAREELLRVLEWISDRVVIPHQVAREYNRNRVKVVTDRRKELSDVADEIDELRANIRRVVGKLRDRRLLHGEELSVFDASAGAFSASLQDASSSASGQYDLDPARLVGSMDELTKKLSEIFSGRVLDPSPEDVVENDRREAARRKEEKLAPGYKDQAGGDYLWWAEVLRLPEISGLPLVVISDDAAKGDWRFEEHGISIGPQEILFEDVRRVDGTDLILLTTRDLFEVARRAGFGQVSDATIEESEKVISERRSEWSEKAYRELLRTLYAEGYDSRADVIRAAASAGGYLERSQIYEIAGLNEENRSLRRFATPVMRISLALVNHGVLSEDAPDALKAEYSGPGKAEGYSVPWEFGGFERNIDEDELAG